MPVSCSDFVLYVVRLGLLYFCVKSWHYKKKHVKKGFDKTKASWEGGYSGSRAVGHFLMAINSMVPFVTVSVVAVVVVSVLMLIFL